jgi:hypothetical protein
VSTEQEDLDLLAKIIDVDGDSETHYIAAGRILAAGFSRHPAPETEWEYGWNTGSSCMRLYTRESAEDFARNIGAVIGAGDQGSRFGRRRKAGPWVPVEVKP